MKIRLNRDEFLDALNLCSEAVVPDASGATAGTFTHMSHILFEVEKNKLKLTANDMESIILAKINAKYEDESDIKNFSMPASLLTQSIANRRTEDIEIEIFDDGKASIDTNSSYIEFNKISADGFPSSEIEVDESKMFVISKIFLKEGIEKTLYSVSKDKSKIVINGMLLTIRDGKLKIVGTDARRLALFDINLEDSEQDDCEVNLPSKACNILLKMLDFEGILKIFIEENKFYATVGDFFMSTRLIHGDFPDYNQVFSPERNYRIMFDREQLLEAINRLRIVENILTFNFSKNSLEIVSEKKGFALAKEKISIKYKGEDYSASFDGKLLSEPLSHIADDEIAFEVIDADSQCFIKDKDNFSYAIMPMLVASE